MENILKAAIERGASDVHIKAGDVFRARIDGKLQPLTKQRLTPEQTRGLVLKLIPNETDRARIDQIKDYDCSWGAPGVGRFRVNILRQRSSFMIVMRVIPFEVPSIEKLGLPEVLQTIAGSERGMILVTGVTGSGKSSTMAAIINQINARTTKHIVTLESPIEFLHRDLQGSVSQREIGVDTESFAMGLRAALRQDPDVILVGELRDTETIDTAMTAAETGHLVLSTMLTPDAMTTVARLVAMFPPEDQEVARTRLSDALQAVVSQRLLPRIDGKGRVAVLEVMVATAGIRELIRDRNRVAEIRDRIGEGAREGMQTFDQHLADLVGSGAVTLQTALASSSNPADFELLIERRKRSPRPISKTPPAGATEAQEAPAGYIAGDLNDMVTQ